MEPMSRAATLSIVMSRHSPCRKADQVRKINTTTSRVTPTTNVAR